jgi:superfamily I DNA and/or RNA helicase
MQSMRNEIEGLRLQRDEKQMEMDSVINNDMRRGELNLELKQIKAKIFDLSQRLDSEKDKAQQSRRAMDAEQRKMRIKILSEADVICSTLSGAGHDYMSQLPFDFETVIIDEAAQSIELSSLIPLKYGCTKCILVGGERLLSRIAKSLSLTHPDHEQIPFNYRRLSSRVSQLEEVTTDLFSFGSCSEDLKLSTSSGEAHPQTILSIRH